MALSPYLREVNKTHYAETIGNIQGHVHVFIHYRVTSLQVTHGMVKKGCGREVITM